MYLRSLLVSITNDSQCKYRKEIICHSLIRKPSKFENSPKEICSIVFSHSVRLGDLQLDSNYDGASPIDVQVDRVITHPQFVLTPRLMNNIALIRLNTSVEYTRKRYVLGFYFLYAFTYSCYLYSHIMFSTATIRPVCLQNGPEYLTDDYYLKRNPFVVDWDRKSTQITEQ